MSFPDGVLLLPSVRLSDAGVYSCNGTNSLGTAESDTTIMLRVYCEWIHHSPLELTASSSAVAAVAAVMEQHISMEQHFHGMCTSAYILLVWMVVWMVVSFHSQDSNSPIHDYNVCSGYS